MQMEHTREDIRSFGKIALLHKIYAWLLILLALIAAILVTFGFSFASLLMAFNLNNLGSALIESYRIGLFITFVFGIFNLWVEIKLKENSRYGLLLSLLSIVVMLLIRGTVIDYFFATAITLVWMFHFKKAKYLLYATPLLVVFGIYNGYLYLKYKVADEFCSAVYYSATYGELKKMLDKGISPNIQNDHGMTPLFYAKDPRKAELLLEYGANPNYENSYKHTPLFSNMIHENQREFFDILVRYGANINHQDMDGDTVLHESVYWGRYTEVEAILANKPDLSIKNNKGKTVIDIATERYKYQVTRNPISDFYLGRATKVIELLSIDPKAIEDQS